MHIPSPDRRIQRERERERERAVSLSLLSAVVNNASLYIYIYCYGAVYYIYDKFVYLLCMLSIAQRLGQSTYSVRCYYLLCDYYIVLSFFFHRRTGKIP
jgi:hypothetical protein